MINGNRFTNNFRLVAREGGHLSGGNRLGVLDKILEKVALGAHFIESGEKINKVGLIVLTKNEMIDVNKPSYLCSANCMVLRPMASM